MKKVIPSIAAASFGLVIGLLASRTTTRATTAIEDQTPARTRADRSEDKSQAGHDLHSNSKHTLSGLLHLNMTRVYRDDIDRQLLSADDEHLEKLLRDLIARDPSGGSLPVVNLRNRVVREIYQRKGPASLGWAEQIGHPEVFGEFIGQFAREDVLAAADWVDRFKAVSGRRLKERIEANPALPSGSEPLPEFDRLEYLGLFSDLSYAAMAQGADIALAFRKRFVEEYEEIHGSLSVPDDFDCQKYLEALDQAKIAGDARASDLIGFWAAQDKDAALAFVEKLPEPSPDRFISYYGKLFGSVCLREGEKAAAGWLSDSLARRTEAERNRILSELYPIQRPSPDAFRDVMDGLLDEQDRIAFAASIIRPRSTREEVLPYLGLLDQESLRASVIEASARTWAEKSTTKGQAANHRGFYESIMAEVSVPPDVRSRVIDIWQKRETSLPD